MEQILTEVEQKLADTLGENVKILNSGSLGGGCINHASKLETTAGTFFLKWNANFAADVFEREAEGMQALAEAAGKSLIVPGVICFKAVDSSPGFLVLEYLEPNSGGHRSDEQLGRGLAHIHRFTHRQFGFENDNYCGATPQQNRWNDHWPSFFRDQRLGFLLNLIEKKRGLSANEQKTYDRLLDRLPQLIPANSSPSLIHGDLWSGNYMLTNSGPALIDPAAYFADREMEFSIVTMFGGFSSRFFDAYKETFPLASDWRNRNQLYQLYHILNHYYLFGGGYGSQALAVAKFYL